MKDKVINFCEDVKSILMEQDRYLYSQMMNEDVSKFYESDLRGLGLFSTTEPNIKYLIISKLCHKYMMWSEKKYDSSRKLLDLAILLDEENCKSEFAEPDTAIEMKYGTVTRDGRLKERSINDFCKMKYCKIRNKYFMQFFITDKDINNDVIQKELVSRIDRRSYKGKYEIIYNKSFETDAGIENPKSRFHIVVWHINC